MEVVLHNADAVAVLRTLRDSSVDAIVTDPPAGIGFMGKEWDDFRRSRNDADAGRDNVFGRTSKTGPQYGRRKRQMPWQYAVTGHGFSDGANRLESPVIGRSALNPTCGGCGKRKRTWKGGPAACACDRPQFNEQAAHLDARTAFIAFLTDVMRECLRVLKPGGHALVWAIPRTSHWTATAVEDAGFEIRDRICHIFGTGFPKSLDVSKAIDKAAGHLGSGLSVVALKHRLIELFDQSGKTRSQIDRECGFRACNYLSLPSDGKRFDPWVNVLPSQAKWRTLKSVLGCVKDGKLDALFAEAEREVIGQQTKARSANSDYAIPSEGSKTSYQTWDITAPATDAAKEWSGWGTALKPAVEDWILARKPLSESTVAKNVVKHGTGALNIDGGRIVAEGRPLRIKVGTQPSVNCYGDGHNGSRAAGETSLGRWPANLTLDEEGAAELDRMSGNRSSTRASGNPNNPVHQKLPNQLMSWGGVRETHDYRDSGGASRFFYCAKASKSDRGEGNTHPTVKNTNLMRWLCRLITPPGGTVLDCFMGSGSTGKAAVLEGFGFIGIEQAGDYFKIAEHRIAKARQEKELLLIPA